MGESKVAVPIKLGLATVARLNDDAKRFERLEVGVSTLARVLIEEAYRMLDEGILHWPWDAVNGAPRNSGNGHGIPDYTQEIKAKLDEEFGGYLERAANHQAMAKIDMQVANKQRRRP